MFERPCYHSLSYGKLRTSHKIRRSVCGSPSPPKLGLLSVLLLPPHWFSIKCFHGGPFHSHRGSPPPTDPHTDISSESHLFLTVCPHTPALPFPHLQSLLFYKSQMVSPIHNLMMNPIICTAQFRGSKTE